MSSATKALLFNTQSYRGWAEQLLLRMDLEAGEIQHKDFPDGEHYQRLITAVAERDVLIVSGTISDRETVELFDLANAIVDGGAQRLRILLPYFGYSTMERAVKTGEAVKAKYRARLLSNGIPRAPLGNSIYLLDLHSEGIPQYFENGTHTTHVYAKPIVMRVSQELFRRHSSQNNFVLASTDAGRMKWVESLAKDMGVSPAFAYKERIDGSSTVTLGISGPVQGKFVVIYDDMIRTGSSLINAARAYLAAGATAVAAVATHALLPADALQKIQESGLFAEIVVSDSHPRSRLLESEFLRVESCVDLFIPYLNGNGMSSMTTKELGHANA